MAGTSVPEPEQTHLKVVQIESILRGLYGTLHSKHEIRVELLARLKERHARRGRRRLIISLIISEISSTDIFQSSAYHVILENILELANNAYARGRIYLKVHITVLWIYSPASQTHQRKCAQFIWHRKPCSIISHVVEEDWAISLFSVTQPYS